jgi:hypothetical protein
VPFPSVSKSLNMSWKLLLDVLIIYLSFSIISTSHVELEELCETIVALAPGGAVFTFLTVELPVYLMLSKTALKLYLSRILDFTVSVIFYHKV